ncbi:MAG: hypothetical protein F6K54_02655, partial [Okeania sp. SIO3B5]|nr:hypothetical protein [Okeania sp. SIO3B5]
SLIVDRHTLDGEMGRWGDGEMGRWGDGGMGRWVRIVTQNLPNLTKPNDS